STCMWPGAWRGRSHAWRGSTASGVTRRGSAGRCFLAIVMLPNKRSSVGRYSSAFGGTIACTFHGPPPAQNLGRCANEEAARHHASRVPLHGPARRDGRRGGAHDGGEQR